LVGQGSLLYCETKVIGQDSYLVLRYFDTSGDQLKELDEKQILMNVNYYYFKLYGVLQNQGKLIFSVFNPPNDDFPSFYYQYIKINFKGDILSTIDLNNLNTTLIKDWYSEDENIYGIELIQDDENNIPLKTGLSFVRYYGSFQRDILKTYEFKDSTRLGYPYLFIDIPNTNDVISIWSEAALHINQSGSLSYDNGAFTKSIMRTDKSIFEFPISNAIEIDSDENELLIYPNPVDDILYIQCRVDKYNLKITNINGQTIKVCDDCSWIEMSDVLPGSYFIQITTDEGKVNSILFIKI
ncbi:MAG: T9SS type A sorting domain-containing protein, partial [Saprospiraceae bacterium]|nr:T9SS type A sorting domain-containing protein [Saprospiraceae bacterium]